LILLISRPWSIAISRRDNQLKEAASFDAASFLKSNWWKQFFVNRIFLKNSTILGSIELLLTFAQWQFPLSQLITEKQIHCQIDRCIYFVRNIFFLEKSIQLKVPFCYCGFKLPCESIVFDFHDNNRLFEIFI
jgi:hypothetical protein